MKRVEEVMNMLRTENAALKAYQRSHALCCTSESASSPHHEQHASPGSGSTNAPSRAHMLYPGQSHPPSRQWAAEDGEVEIEGDPYDGYHHQHHPEKGPGPRSGPVPRAMSAAPMLQMPSRSGSARQLSMGPSSREDGRSSSIMSPAKSARSVKSIGGRSSSSTATLQSMAPSDPFDADTNDESAYVRLLRSGVGLKSGVAANKWMSPNGTRIKGEAARGNGEVVDSEVVEGTDILQQLEHTRRALRDSIRERNRLMRDNLRLSGKLQEMARRVSASRGSGNNEAPDIDKLSAGINQRTSSPARKTMGPGPVSAKGRPGVSPGRSRPEQQQAAGGRERHVSPEERERLEQNLVRLREENAALHKQLSLYRRNVEELDDENVRHTAKIAQLVEQLRVAKSNELLAEYKHGVRELAKGFLSLKVIINQEASKWRDELDCLRGLLVLAKRGVIVRGEGFNLTSRPPEPEKAGVT
mmetsp:Transcript_39187/g.63530  ORF Transcript_39187/g.63530 Transcript_39187/m.63530 type:complete len:471 (+) Transcript_39187:104-1516(+)